LLQPAIGAAVAAALYSCSHRVDTTLELVAAAASSSSSSAELHQVVEQGPVDRQTVVVEEFLPPKPGDDGPPVSQPIPPSGGAAALSPVPGMVGNHADQRGTQRAEVPGQSVVSPGPLLRRTTTTTEHLGPARAQTDVASLAQTQAATSTHEQLHETRETQGGPPTTFWVSFAVVLGIVLFVVNRWPRPS
jgi:hypothetical protein